MNAQQAVSRFFHRPVRVRVKFPNASCQILGFIKDEEDFDSFEKSAPTSSASICVYNTVVIEFPCFRERSFNPD